MGKASMMVLSEEDREYLHSIMRSSTSPRLVSKRAWILLLREKGVPVAVISDSVGINRDRVLYCIEKYKTGGVKHALYGAPGRGGGKGSQFSDEEKSWIIYIVSQRPRNVGCPAEIWTYMRLTKFINENAEAVGYNRLATISCSSIVNILKQAGVQPRMLRYPEHLQRRYPNASSFY